MCRQGLFFPSLYSDLALPLGIPPGIQLSQPAADLCSFLVALPMGLGVLRDLRLAQEGLEALKEDFSRITGAARERVPIRLSRRLRTLFPAEAPPREKGRGLSISLFVLAPL